MVCVQNYAHFMQISSASIGGAIATIFERILAFENDVVALT
jgi:hypothetical protein